MSIINKNFIFIHIPKTAGTSIEHIIGGSGHDSISDYIKLKKNLINSGDYKLPPVLCFVRNPYDRLVSAYHCITQLGINYAKANNIDLLPPTFEKLVMDIKKYGNISFNIPHFYPQYFFIEHEGEIKSDRIYRFENLLSDFENMKKEFNINGTLPHMQTSRHRNYKEYYTNELKEIVYNFYRKDFDLFNYNKEL